MLISVVEPRITPRSQLPLGLAKGREWGRAELLPGLVKGYITALPGDAIYTQTPGVLISMRVWRHFK